MVRCVRRVVLSPRPEGCVSRFAAGARIVRFWLPAFAGMTTGRYGNIPLRRLRTLVTTDHTRGATITEPRPGRIARLPRYNDC